jgi:hypothetical protein
LLLGILKAHGQELKGAGTISPGNFDLEKLIWRRSPEYWQEYFAPFAINHAECS